MQISNILYAQKATKKSLSLRSLWIAPLRGQAGVEVRFIINDFNVLIDRQSYSSSFYNEVNHMRFSYCFRTVILGLSKRTVCSAMLYVYIERSVEWNDTIKFREKRMVDIYKSSDL